MPEETTTTTPAEIASVQDALEDATCDIGGPAAADLAVELRRHGWVHRPKAEPYTFEHVDALIEDGDLPGAVKILRIVTGDDFATAKLTVQARKGELESNRR